MAPQISRGRVSIVVLLASLVLPLLFPECYYSSVFIVSAAAPESDVDLLEFPLNLEYLEAEFFLFVFCSWFSFCFICTKKSFVYGSFKVGGHGENNGGGFNHTHSGICR